MSGISCHVLDTARGRPAAGLAVRLERWTEANGELGSGWQIASRSQTNADGRALGLEGSAGVLPGSYRLSFETAAYLRREGHPVFYPEVQVLFVVEAGEARYHIPLLLSPFGYSTYRGS